MKKQIKIGKKLVGNNHPCRVVAELSGNHDGNFNRMKKLMLSAKKSGADYLKIQTYTPDKITLKSNKKDFLITNNSPWKSKKNLWNLYNKAYTPWSWHKKIFDYAKKIKIDLFSSPFDESAVDMLEKLKCPAYKIASAEINHIPLIEKIAKTKKPVILSIGLANIEDIRLALKTLKKNKCNNIIILQCVSAYPSPLEEQNIKSIPKIKNDFKVLSGLSDHTIGYTSALASVALGGNIVEKHFNLSDQKKTVDSFFSSNKEEFIDMIKEIRKIEAVLGHGKILISKSSKKNINSKRSIYISKKINKGCKITSKNIRVVRPSLSLHPKYYNQILGKKVRRNFDCGDRITLKDIF